MQQTTTAQVAEFSDWMSTNGYNFTGATKTAALKNFVTNMVSCPVPLIDPLPASSSAVGQNKRLACLPRELAPAMPLYVRTHPHS